MKNQKIIPFLWFDDNIAEAVDFYVSLFPNSKIGKIARYGEAGAKASGRSLGSIMTEEFQLEGQDFVALNGGPEFKFTPAISFFVSFQEVEEMQKVWQRLIVGGKVLMELGKYPFSERYGWLEDKFGVSWQLNFASSQQKIKPALLFVGKQYGRAEEAMKFYTSIFGNSKIKQIARYEKGEEDREGMVKYAEFELEEQGFIAMESGLDHKFTFTPAISFLVSCDTQEEIDEFWGKLTEGGGKEVQCGWLEDKFGISWQITPKGWSEMMSDPDKEKSERVMEAMLKMVKLDIAKLKEAYEK